MLSESTFELRADEGGRDGIDADACLKQARRQSGVDFHANLTHYFHLDLTHPCL
jgi:hypothetical protein